MGIRSPHGVGRKQRWGFRTDNYLLGLGEALGPNWRLTKENMRTRLMINLGWRNESITTSKCNWRPTGCN